MALQGTVRVADTVRGTRLRRKVFGSWSGTVNAKDLGPVPCSSSEDAALQA